MLNVRRDRVYSPAINFYWRLRYLGTVAPYYLLVKWRNKVFALCWKPRIEAQYDGRFLFGWRSH